MLSVVCKFSFRALVTEEFDLAVGELAGRAVLEGCIGGETEVLCLCDETDRDALDAF